MTLHWGTIIAVSVYCGPSLAEPKPQPHHVSHSTQERQAPLDNSPARAHLPQPHSTLAWQEESLNLCVPQFPHLLKEGGLNGIYPTMCEH